MTGRSGLPAAARCASFFFHIPSQSKAGRANTHARLSRKVNPAQRHLKGANLEWPDRDPRRPQRCDGKRTVSLRDREVIVLDHYRRGARVAEMEDHRPAVGLGLPTARNGDVKGIAQHRARLRGGSSVTRQRTSLLVCGSLMDQAVSIGVCQAGAR